MALIQGMENVNKTGVRFRWWVNGGFLEGAGAGAICHSQFDDPPSATLVNIVPLWKGIDNTSIARTVKNQVTVASKLVWIYNRLSISFMQVSKWGNSLAVRLPAVVVEALDLKDGDEIEISIAGKRDFKVARDRSKERALEQLRQMKWSFPPDFKFNREEINER